MKKSKLIFLIACCFHLQQLVGQVSMSAAWNQDSVVIGTDATLTLSIETDPGVEVVAISGMFLDSIYSALASIKAQTDTSQPIIPKIADFEIVNFGNWSQAGDDQVFMGEELGWNQSQAGGKTLYENTFTIKLWDPGEIIALYPALVYRNADGQDQYVKEGQIKTFVVPPGGLASQDSLAVADIKPILTESKKLSDYLLYFIIIGIVLLASLVYWLFTKYQKRQIEKSDVIQEVVIPPPAHEVALEKLHSLREKELWQQGDIKGYQSELTYIIREYLENRYDVLALESTTDEIVTQVSQALEQGDVISLKRILQVADLVKFAKAKPTSDIHEEFMKEAFQFVEKTKEEEEQSEL